ncbi:MAG: sigma-70 family RNA polymerase sigma factor [Planctomycetes bacterium]|nr:sigma-70 family RNA polymerase sigma factor [Planctomycetota bacterium]
MNQEDTIIQDVLAGDTNAFRRIIEQHQMGVFHMIAHLVYDRSAAEDLTQEVFMTAFEKLSSYDPQRCRFSTWLFTLARHRSINYIRKKKRKRPQHNQPVASPDPAQPLCQEEFYQQLDGALNELPQPQKRAFVLAEFQQLPYDEIAQIECISIGTVRSRIHRAKRRLRTLMKDESS